MLTEETLARGSHGDHADEENCLGEKAPAKLASERRNKDHGEIMHASIQ